MSRFRIQYNGLTLEGGGDYSIEEVSGLFTVPIRTASQELTGGDGGNIWAQNFGMRTIGIEGKIFTDDAASFFTAIRELNAAFTKTEESLPLVIRLWDDSEKTLYARVLQMPEIILQKDLAPKQIAAYRVSLLCEDPYYQDNDETEYTVGLTQDAGAAIPTPIPMSLSAGTGGSVTVVNNGDVASYAEFEIQGVVNNPTVQNVTTDEQFQIGASLSSSDIVYVNKTTRGLSVSLNNSTNYYEFFNGTFFKLAPGNNVIKFSASNYDASALLTIRFSQRTQNPV